MREWTPPDQEARDRIATDLETNLLVEAGAGSGKTTAMVGRMIALIESGTAEVEQIAAVTFTRKAASELKERFQERLEEEYRAAEAGETRDHLSRALSGIDRCFVGTIHSFCGRLLRERPLEAGVAPGFQEISGADEDRLRGESWSRCRDWLSARRSRVLRELSKVGLRPAQLKTLFEEVSANPDVRYLAPEAPEICPGELDAVRSGLGRLLDESLTLLPAEQPAAGWDGLQTKMRTLRFLRHSPGWEGEVRFFEALSTALATKNAVTQNRWGSDKETKQAAKALGESWDEFTAEGGAADRLLKAWQARRYVPALRFARAAAAFYRRERIRSGHLSFQDLLVLSARLLRTHPGARRALSERWRYLLIDEFQDTDPVQAEVLFLLASSDPEQTDWQGATPAPGALFVVGDPKQSIYRFRRADISVYNQVKERFRGFGAVLGLSANFRSGRAVEALVNRVFEGPFPAAETEHQAGFVPLSVVPAERALEGVFWHRFEPAPGYGGFTGPRISEPDSQWIASWIEERIEKKERAAGDFLILTRTKKQIAAYARALESRNIPVQVSGAGALMEEELKELVLLLRALQDPGDPVLTLAALEGLFFGLSHEELYRHVRSGGDFQFLRAAPIGEPAVTEALQQMRGFWKMVQNAPADVAVPRIVEQLGVLPHAAAGELGGTRAGALLYALDTLRLAALDGKTSLAEAVEVLEGSTDEEVETPLVPGEGDRVRVMNLHKAKGLEAPVVILAFPCTDSDHAITRHITRDEGSEARGYIRVSDSAQLRGPVLARPLDWETYEAAEAPFQDAEEIRLLYVAATRAGEELVVSRCTRTEATSVWTLFHGVLDEPEVASELAVEIRPMPPREALSEEGETIRMRTRAAEERRRAGTRPSYVQASVTARVKASGFGEGRPSGAGGKAGRGPDWGTAVHRALEAAGRGADGLELRSACRGFLIEAERPVDDHGSPLELDELVTLVGALRRSALWRRATAAERLLVEAPFSLSVAAAEARRLGLLPADEEELGRAEPAERVEGVIDLVFREADGGWVIGDYKTDVFGGAEARRDRTLVYRRQVDLYAACWSRITGERVKERVLFFTGEGREVTW